MPCRHSGPDKEKNISTGKAYLIRQVMEMLGDDAAFDKLAALSVEELRDILEQEFKAIPIGKSAAVRAAETYAGTLDVDSVTCKVDPELDENSPHYEVELSHPTLGRFEFEIDAFDGAVLSGEKDIFEEPDQSESSVKPVKVENSIGSKAAKAAALKDAGFGKSQVTRMKSERDEEDGGIVYKIEFSADGMEYEYTIDGTDETVLEPETEEAGEGCSGKIQKRACRSFYGRPASVFSSLLPIHRVFVFRTLFKKSSHLFYIFFLRLCYTGRNEEGWICANCYCWKTTQRWGAGSVWP